MAKWPHLGHNGAMMDSKTPEVAAEARKQADPYREKRTKVYFKNPAEAAALEALADRNRAEGRQGDTFSSLLAMLGRKYVKQPKNLRRLREAGFGDLASLLAI